ncbi:MAG TPA: hypothetical protein VMT53_18140 [Terriglobales bacterium]|nr:hypothetical protein [Terriglobales bacterium]
MSANHYSVRVFIGALGAVLILSAALAQNIAPQERTFHASKAVVEKALQDFHGTSGGKLPTLEGFVNGSADSLTRYQRGFYQFSVAVTPVDAVNTRVRVSAKITAWYKDEVAANSGYKVLPSNGRLESDLLDNVEDTLKSTAASPSGNTEAISAAPSSPAPDSPSNIQAGTSVFQNALSTAAAKPVSHEKTAEDSATEQRIQQLTTEGNSLREVLRNQSRPSNLAVIRNSKTPLLDRPMEGAKAVLLAEAEDEFQIVDTTGNWVHVQVSGLSRGWVRRDQVDIPSATAASLSTLEQDPATFDRPPAFEQTREEVSVFPGKWEPLDGKKVKIIWVQPSDKKSFGTEPKLNLVKTVFKNSFGDVAKSTPAVAGVVVILDSEDGGMAATTLAALQQWHAGHLPDGAFWKRCLLDPAEVFKTADQ